MTRAKLVERILEQCVHRVDIVFTPAQIQERVDALFESIKAALARGDEVELRGFGSFRLRRRKVREGRNPKTGAAVHVPEKVVPFFKAGAELREMVDP